MTMRPTITVVGLGYVGLPTCLAFHDAGFDVQGLDINENVISGLLEGNSHLLDSTDGFEIPTKSKRWAVN